MKNLTPETQVICELFNFFGSLQELKELIKGTGEYHYGHVVSIQLANQEPFCTVDENFINNAIGEKIEGIGSDRSTEDGDEMQDVIDLILKHTKVDYKAIMEEMPTLWYGDGNAFEFDLDEIERLQRKEGKE